MRSSTVPGCISAFVSLFAAATAVAAPNGGRERVAVAAFELTGEAVSEEAQARLRNSLRGGLSTGFEVVPDAEVTRAVESAGVRGCDTLACIRRIGELVFVRRVVTARIQVLGPMNTNTTLELIDLPTDKRYTATDHCTPCTQLEVNDGVSNAAASLKTQLDAAENSSAAAAPQNNSLVTTTAAPPPYRRSMPLLVAGGIAGGLGLAGTIFGFVEVGRQGNDCSGAGTNCQQRRDTTDGIIFGFAAGVPLLVGGIVMTYFGLRYPRR
jgi:hypothetical protein